MLAPGVAQRRRLQSAEIRTGCGCDFCHRSRTQVPMDGDCAGRRVGCWRGRRHFRLAPFDCPTGPFVSCANPTQRVLCRTLPLPDRSLSHRLNAGPRAEASSTRNLAKGGPRPRPEIPEGEWMIDRSVYEKSSVPPSCCDVAFGRSCTSIRRGCVRRPTGRAIRVIHAGRR